MKPLQVLSYGGGVQSTAILLMALDGVIERPDLVVFADTGSELPETYATVARIRQMCIDAGQRFEIAYGAPEEFEEGISLHEYYMQKETFPYLPMVRNPQCTFKFKIRPVRNLIKSHELFSNQGPKPHAISWLGISTDERKRARKSDVQWIETSYPLLNLGLSRKDCINYIEKHYPALEVSKSGCFCCPYSSGKTFVDLKITHPDLFQICIDMEKNARDKGMKKGLRGGHSIEAYNSSITLKKWGLRVPEDYACESSQGGCFL